MICFVYVCDAGIVLFNRSCVGDRKMFFSEKNDFMQHMKKSFHKFDTIYFFRSDVNLFARVEIFAFLVGLLGEQIRLIKADCVARAFAIRYFVINKKIYSFDADQISRHSLSIKVFSNFSLDGIFFSNDQIVFFLDSIILSYLQYNLCVEKS